MLLLLCGVGRERVGSMLSVLRVHLPSDIPIVGCELTPYVLLRRPDKSVNTEDVPESAPLDGHFMRYKWLVLLLLFIILSSIEFEFDSFEFTNVLSHFDFFGWLLMDKLSVFF